MGYFCYEFPKPIVNDGSSTPKSVISTKQFPISPKQFPMSPKHGPVPSIGTIFDNNSFSIPSAVMIPEPTSPAPQKPSMLLDFGEESPEQKPQTKLLKEIPTNDMKSNLHSKQNGVFRVNCIGLSISFLLKSYEILLKFHKNNRLL